MEGTYHVCRNGLQVGTVMLTRCGLYYEVSGRCRMEADQMWHLMMETENVSEDLGIMVPIGSWLALRKKIPVKRLAKGVPSFFLKERYTSIQLFIPVKPEEPYPYLHLLNESTLATQGETKGISISKKTAEKAKIRG